MEDIRQRGGSVALDVSALNGGISGAVEKQSLLKSIMKESLYVLADPQSKKIYMFGILNLLTVMVLLVWCSSTNSMALTAFTLLTIFDLFSLLTCVVSIWVRLKRPSHSFSFGYERFEVLAVFSSTLMAQLAALFIIKESVERLVQQPDIHEGRLLLGTGLAFVIHMLVSYGVENKAFTHVVSASSSSWLQEHVTDISESLCNVLPGMSKLLLPRINPFALVGSASAAACVIVFLLIDMQNYHASDTWAAVWIALMMSGTMFPMSVYTGKILLQTTPSHMISQLDKCLREASTLDGVLEFRNEHFWTLAFGSMAGSVHVRIRRDADEQMVLAHVYHRLSNLVSVLTVQVFKDDWNRTHTFQLLDHTSLLKQGMSPPLQQQASLNPSLYAPTVTSTLHTLGIPVTSSLYTVATPLTSSISSTNINVNKLNTDILNLLGSTSSVTMATSSSPQQQTVSLSPAGGSTSMYSAGRTVSELISQPMSGKKTQYVNTALQ